MSGRITAPLLQKPPKRVPGVPRANKVPLYAMCGVAVLIGTAIMYSFHEKGLHEQVQEEKDSAAGTTGAADIGSANFAVGRNLQDGTTPTTKKDGDGQPTAHTQDTSNGKAPQNPIEQVRLQAWQQYYQKIAQDQQATEELQTQAYNAGTDVSTTGNGGGGAPGGMPPSLTIPGLPGGVGGAAFPGGPTAGVDAGAQAEKRGFLNSGSDVFGLNETLDGSVHGPKHDTVMEGTSIAGNLIGGMGSDMPGMVKGQVAVDVCDSETGDHLLIPAGTMVVGHYDNSVSTGQTRIGFIWDRFIFPDTSSRQLGGMEGADQSGYAGAHDQVDTHFWEKFKSAVIVSLIGAGAQLAQPPPPTNGFYSPWSTATGSFTNQMQQFGMSQANASQQVPNSLNIRPGYPFQIMVQKDIPMPVYHNTSCGAGGQTMQAAQPIHLGPILQ